eukprot:TRINITY_DN16122_c0_g1_i1.p1 TRINITY_DN16122_c0_g1~~TRINITY_DN16122_c0_g1_i1.p1  ORF type:complete len:642 (+),score=198.77 TRINITY_DN16122_c0_g1_i1:118-2043(+)
MRRLVVRNAALFAALLALLVLALHGYAFGPEGEGVRAGAASAGGAEVFVFADRALDGNVREAQDRYQQRGDGAALDPGTALEEPAPLQGGLLAAAENGYCMVRGACPRCLAAPECFWCASAGACMAKTALGRCNDRDVDTCTGASAGDPVDALWVCYAEEDAGALAPMLAALNQSGVPTRAREDGAPGCILLRDGCAAAAKPPAPPLPGGAKALVYTPPGGCDGGATAGAASPVVADALAGVRAAAPRVVRALPGAPASALSVVTNTRNLGTWLKKRYKGDVAGRAVAELKVVKGLAAWRAEAADAAVCVVGTGLRHMAYADAAVAAGCLPVVVLPLLITRAADDRLPPEVFTERKRLLEAIEDALGKPQLRAAFNKYTAKYDADAAVRRAAAVRKFLAGHAHVVAVARPDGDVADAVGFAAATHALLPFASVEVVVCGAESLPEGWGAAFEKLGAMGVWAVATPAPSCAPATHPLTLRLAPPAPAPWYTLYLPSPRAAVLSADAVAVLATELRLRAPDGGARTAALGKGVYFSRRGGGGARDPCLTPLVDGAEAPECTLNAAELYAAARIEGMQLVDADPDEDTLPLPALAAYRAAVTAACAAFPALHGALPAGFRCAAPTAPVHPRSADPDPAGEEGKG